MLLSSDSRWRFVSCLEEHRVNMVLFLCQTLGGLINDFVVEMAADSTRSLSRSVCSFRTSPADGMKPAPFLGVENMALRLVLREGLVSSSATWRVGGVFWPMMRGEGGGVLGCMSL